MRLSKLYLFTTYNFLKESVKKTLPLKYSFYSVSFPFDNQEGNTAELINIHDSA